MFQFKLFSVILTNKIKIKLQTNIMMLVYCYDGGVNNFSYMHSSGQGDEAKTA